MSKYAAIATAYLAAAYAAVAEFVLRTVSKVPFLPDFYSVDYALSGFDRVLAKLAAAQAEAHAAADRYGDLADFYADREEAALNEAERVATVQLRLSRLLD